MADFMDKVKECTVKCRYFQEFGFTLGFTLFAFGGGYSAWKFAMTYAVFYHTMKATFDKSLAMLNPAVAFAEFMQKNISIGEFIMFWFAQSFGAFFGFGILNMMAGSFANDPANAVPAYSSDNFYSTVLNESLSVGLLIWLWLDMHSKDRAATYAEQFYGFAPGLIYFLALVFVNDSSFLNPAIFEGQWGANMFFSNQHFGMFKSDVWTAGFSVENLTMVFAPIVAAFIACLMYAHFNK